MNIRSIVFLILERTIEQTNIPAAIDKMSSVGRNADHAPFPGSRNDTEPDGEKESKPVTVNSDNQSLTIGDDTKYYKLDGNQLTIEDDDHDPNDTVVLTK